MLKKSFESEEAFLSLTNPKTILKECRSKFSEENDKSWSETTISFDVVDEQK
jgi:hypothetical protein